MAAVVRLLGEVGAEVDGQPVELGTPRQRCVLAALAVDAGRVVPVDRLVERVWGVGVAPRARATLHNYISRLRQALAGADGVVIVRRSSGYALIADTTEPAVDLHRFRNLCSAADAEVDDKQAAQLLTDALRLWRGQALTGVDGEWAESERDRLERERLATQYDLTDVRLRQGRGGDLVVELAARAADHPLDERVAGQYMLALHQVGRTADALEHYRRLRERLIEELGIDPGTALQELHRRILAADAMLTTSPGTMVAEPVMPRQLPAAPLQFTGRGTDLAALTATLDEAGLGRTVVISSLTGAGGIGKTWLAVHWAHQQRDRFPDGQLFVDLRGFSPDSEPMAPSVAVRGFLDALGVGPGRIPVDPQAQTALLRSLVADKRMLMVLDNAADTEQVAPLLPGGDSCTVVVTSRRTLTGLVTRHGAHHLTLDTFGDTEAHALLARRLGVERVAAEPDAVTELVRLCGGFPLALGIIAGRAHAHPYIPLAELAADLRGLGVGALEDDDPATGLPTVLSWSYRALSIQQQTVFGLLGIAPGSEIGLPAAASLTGLSSAQTARVLRGLQEASLLSRDARGRYSMHDLIRRYATDTAHQFPDEVREAALRRVVAFYLRTAESANRLLDSYRPDPPFGLPVPASDLHPLPDRSAALAWFSTEHPCLLAAQHTAITQHWHQAVWRLARALSTFLTRLGYRHDRLAVWQAGLVAAEHLHDPTTRAQTHRNLGGAYARLGLHEEAIRHAHQSLALAEHHHDHTNQAHAHHGLAWAWGQQGDDRRALEHATHALNIFRTLGSPVWEAQMLNEVGWYAARLGDHDQARDHCLAALTLYRCHPEPFGEALTWDSLGYIDDHTGHHEQAVRHYQQALTLFRDLGSLFQVAGCLDELGHPYSALGQHDQARAVWREALEMYRAQQRDEDAARLQRQLDALDRPNPDRAPDQDNIG